MQQVSLLVTVAPAARATFPALRAMVRTARRLRSRPGFRAWRTYRALDATDALLFVLEWDDPAAREAAQAEMDALTELATAAGFRVDSPRTLVPLLDRRIGVEPAAASLLRVGPAGEVDDDCSLRALAAPGTTRVATARTEDGELGVARVEFEGEDGIWPFLESPLRYRWSERSLGETWALNLPRLEFLATEAPGAEPRQPRVGGSLKVEYSLSRDRRTAHLRLDGQVDAEGCDKVESFCRSLVAVGCHRLHLDVSGLKGISPEALGLLTRTARSVKERGGSFTLVDNARRARRVTRARELEGVLR